MNTCSTLLVADRRSGLRLVTRRSTRSCERTQALITRIFERSRERFTQTYHRGRLLQRRELGSWKLGRIHNSPFSTSTVRDPEVMSIGGKGRQGRIERTTSCRYLIIIQGVSVAGCRRSKALHLKSVVILSVCYCYATE